MGAAPRWATLALGAARGRRALARGVLAPVSSRSPSATAWTSSAATLRAAPRAPSASRRSAKCLRAWRCIAPRARAGDDIWVSGELGGAALALAHPEIAEAAKRLHVPEPRVELGERLRGLAHAGDRRVRRPRRRSRAHPRALARGRDRASTRASRSLRAFAQLNDPQLEKDCVLSGGDDYELAFTAPRDAAQRDRGACARARPAAHAHRRHPGRQHAPYGARRGGQADGASAAASTTSRSR